MYSVKKRLTPKNTTSNAGSYLKARYYAAWTCRFISVDPHFLEYPYLTPYNYAGNKPITHKDIEGMQSTGDKPVQNREGGSNNGNEQGSGSSTENTNVNNTTYQWSGGENQSESLGLAHPLSGTSKTSDQMPSKVEKNSINTSESTPKTQNIIIEIPNPSTDAEYTFRENVASQIQANSERILSPQETAVRELYYSADVQPAEKQMTAVKPIPNPHYGSVIFMKNVAVGVEALAPVKTIFKPVMEYGKQRIIEGKEFGDINWVEVGTSLAPSSVSTMTKAIESSWEYTLNEGNKNIFNGGIGLGEAAGHFGVKFGKGQVKNQIKTK